MKPKIENKSELSTYRKKEPFGGNVGAIQDPVVGSGGDAIKKTMNQMVNDFDQMANNITDLTNKMDKLDEINELEETEKTIPSPFDERGEPNGGYDSAATSGVEAPKDEKYLLKTGEKLHNVFILPNSKKMNATDKMALDYNLRAPAAEMNVMPGVHTSLISACKIADAGFVTVLSKDGLKMYNGATCKIVVSEAAALSGWKTDKGP